MPTPAIQTLINDAQQVLNLDSISAVRSVVAVSLANANTGTPLNPNLTTQQLWNEFYQVVTRSKSDIESIIANQLMKFLYSPPAPGGVGANGQVIFNNNGVLAGDNELFYNATTNTLTTEKLIVPGNTQVAGSASNLYVGSILNPTLFANTNTKLVGIGTASPVAPLDVRSNGNIAGLFLRTTDPAAAVSSAYIQAPVSSGFSSTVPIYGFWYQNSGMGNPAADTLNWIIASGEAMRLNSTGLGVGASPSAWGNAYKVVQTGQALGVYGRANLGYYGTKFNLYNDNTNDVAITTNYVGEYRFELLNGSHVWLNKSSAGTAGVNQTLTQAMTLDASGRLIINSSTFVTPTLNTNGEFNFMPTSNTNVRFSYRGTDGVTRTADITLA